MTQVGTVEIGERAELIRLDAGFCAMMRAPAAAMIGRSVLDVTYPADRIACHTAITRLGETGAPFELEKRLLRPEGTSFWVRNTVSRVDFGDGGTRIVASVVAIDPPVRAQDEVGLVAEARRQAETLEDRAATFGAAMFAQPHWTMLLATYVAGREGRVATLAMITPTPCVDVAQAQRWARALVAEGLLVCFDRAEHAEPCFALSEGGRLLMERFLRRAMLRRMERTRVAA